MSTAHRITPECQPVFPCWLWHEGTWRWIRHVAFPHHDLLHNAYTHWHPDQPEAPTTVPTPPEGAASLDTLKDMSAQVTQLTGAQDRMDAEIAMLTADLFHATRERDQARQDLEERCAENDRERAAHLQAYQEAVKERDGAIANHIAAQSRLTAATEENSELKRRLEEQHKLYCEETKRHNETWAKIHAATRHLNKEFKKLPEDLVEAVKEVTFRVAMLELSRDTLRAQVAQLTSERDEAETSLAEWMSTAQRRADKLTAATEEVELAELRKDKARLDALSGMKCAEFMEGPCVWRINMDKRTDSDQLRSAIDAARNQQENRG